MRSALVQVSRPLQAPIPEYSRSSYIGWDERRGIFGHKPLLCLLHEVRQLLRKCEQLRTPGLWRQQWPKRSVLSCSEAVAETYRGGS